MVCVCVCARWLNPRQAVFVPRPFREPQGLWGLGGERSGLKGWAARGEEEKAEAN